MQWLKSPKISEIQKYVECYWFLEKKETNGPFQTPKLNPDPSGHLMISPETQPYSYTLGEHEFLGKGCHWIFPHLNTFQLDHSNPFVYIGIKFRVGALYAIEIPGLVHPQLNEIASTLVIENSHATQIIDLARTRPDDCVDRLDSLLSPWLIGIQQDKHCLLTNRALQVLNDIDISKIGESIHCSQRTLERSFRKVTGFTMKQCKVMNKLEAMLEQIYKLDGSEINWAEIALEFGFSDQPHLIRHLREQIGLTPKVYSEERGLTIDAYGGIESF